jgi:fibronectin type 3 domain-containing protein
MRSCTPGIPLWRIKMITIQNLKKGIILEHVMMVLMAGTITLAWDANIEPDLYNYLVYYGNSSRNYTTIVDVRENSNCATPYDPFKSECCEITLTGFEKGKTYYFAATAKDDQDNESAFSEELVHIFKEDTKLQMPGGYTKK